MIREPITLIDINGHYVLFDPDMLTSQLIDKGLKIFGISLEAISAFRRHMYSLNYPATLLEADIDGFFNAYNNQNAERGDMD